MGKATDKQIYFLQSKGVDASNMDFETASKIISGFKVPTGTPKIAESPSFKAAIAYEKPKFETSSYYVAYAKDIAVALINKVELKSDANIDKMTEFFMQTAIKAIQDAKEAFK